MDHTWNAQWQSTRAPFCGSCMNSASGLAADNSKELAPVVSAHFVSEKSIAMSRLPHVAGTHVGVECSPARLGGERSMRKPPARAGSMDGPGGVHYFFFLLVARWPLGVVSGAGRTLAQRQRTPREDVPGSQEKASPRLGCSARTRTLRNPAHRGCGANNKYGLWNIHTSLTLLDRAGDPADDLS